MPAAFYRSTTMSNPIQGAVEIIPDRLYCAALKAQPCPDHTFTTTGPDGEIEHKPIHFFSIDTELVYWNFFLDFGPLNLGQLYRFCAKLNQKLESKQFANHVICFCSNKTPARRANAMFLICAWQMLYLNRTPEEAMLGFQAKDPDSMDVVLPASANSSAPPSVIEGNPILVPVPPFHDASPCACTFDLTILDCLKGLEKARTYGFFDFEKFDAVEYEHYEQVENGDLNWIIQKRFLAFAGPQYKRNISKEGYCTLTPSDYIPYFKKNNVGLVVRLNKKCYDETDFTNEGIDHFEQYYLDGSCPPMKVLQKVVKAFEQVPADKAIAVHCKAGLGRTGTCIGAYIMKHYKFSAEEVIGWMRICRPGMVIGPQQHFLKDIEQRMWQEGDAMKLKIINGVSPVPVTPDSADQRAAESKKVKERNKRSGLGSLRFGSLTMDERLKSGPDAVVGRAGQAEGLLARRHKSKTTGSDQLEMMEY